MNKADWITCTKRNPCPICEKTDWCGVTTDGNVVHCMRIESSHPCQGGGWIHRLSEPATPQPPPKASKPPEFKDFTELANRYQDQLIRVDLVAEEFGVSERSLERLGLGWNGNLTWPWRDHEQKIIGISVRGKNGKKWAVEGSHAGLYWPEGVEIEDDGFIFLPEGPTDTAALLTLGVQAIGRPNNWCSEYLVLAFQKKRRDIVIVADMDQPKTRPDGSIWFPGAEGAESCLKALGPLSKSIRILTPPKEKDVRAWINKKGITHDVLMTVVKNLGRAA